MLGNTEKDIYKLLVTTGNAPKMKFEKCASLEDMFNDCIDIHGTKYGLMILGGNHCQEVCEICQNLEQRECHGGKPYQIDLSIEPAIILEILRANIHDDLPILSRTLN
jgi:hypothetical protein